VTQDGLEHFGGVGRRGQVVLGEVSTVGRGRAEDLLHGGRLRAVRPGHRFTGFHPCEHRADLDDLPGLHHGCDEARTG